MSIRIINGKVVNVDLPQVTRQIQKKDYIANRPDFKDILNNEINKNSEIKISGHAIERLKSRNISLDVNDMEKLKNAIDKAEQKGAKESLLLYKDTAFIASIKNRTIITAVDKESSKDNVFTNIDSAVII